MELEVRSDPNVSANQIRQPSNKSMKETKAACAVILFNVMSCVILHHYIICLLTGNRAGLSSRPACRHLSDWLDQNGHNSGNQRAAGERGRKDCAAGHAGLQGSVAHWHTGQAETV